MYKHPQKLFDAVKNQEWDYVKQYINEPTNDINITDNINNPLIHHTILFNNYEITKLLLDKGSFIDFLDSDGYSIFYYPIKYNYEKIFELLVRASNNIIGHQIEYIEDIHQNNILHYMAKFNNLELFKYIKDYNWDYSKLNDSGLSPLHICVENNNYDFTKKLLDIKSIDINVLSSYYKTPLYITCQNNLIDICKLLLKYNANPNICEIDKYNTPLHIAVKFNNQSIIEELIKSNININQQNIFGETPLHTCIKYKHLKLFELIYNSNKHNINPNLTDINHNTYIHLLFELNLMKHEYLLDIFDKLNLNLVNRQNKTILFYIIINNIWKSLKSELIRKRLDVFIIINDKRIIDYIDKNDFNEFIEVIIQSYEYQIKSKKLNPEKNIKDKLLRIYSGKDEYSCRNTSYPVQENDICLDELIQNYDKVDICMLSSNELDIISGFLYLKLKHDQITIIVNDMKNDLSYICNKYKELGIISRFGCLLYEFQLVWIDQNLVYSPNYVFKIKQLYNKNKFLIIHLGIIDREKGAHSNILIINSDKKEVERFEPSGAYNPNGYNYYYEKLDNELKQIFTKIDKDIKYYSPVDYEPVIGFLTKGSHDIYNKKLHDPKGYCISWCIWYIDMRLEFQDIPRDKMIYKMINQFNSFRLSYKNIIRNYSSKITKQRDELLKETNIDFDTWLNHTVDIKKIMNLKKIIDEMI